MSVFTRKERGEKGEKGEKEKLRRTTMLSDAKSLWLSATGAIKNVQSNISTALENIDLDTILQDEESTHGASKAPRDGSTVELMEQELSSYKSLLDDAQMQLVEMGRHSRIMIGES